MNSYSLGFSHAVKIHLGVWTRKPP